MLDIFTKKTSELLSISEEIIHDVISHQWKYSRDKMSEGNSVELTGIGTFEVRPSAMRKRLLKLDSFLRAYTKQLSKEEIDSPKYNTIQKKIGTVNEEINYINRKLNGDT